MFYINWRLGCLAFVTVPNVVVASKYFGTFMRKLAKLLDLPWRLVGCWVTIATKAPTYGLHSTHGPSVTLF